MSDSVKIQDKYAYKINMLTNLLTISDQIYYQFIDILWIIRRENFTMQKKYLSMFLF